MTGFAAPRAWPAQLTPQWKVTVGPGDATLALVGARLHVCTRQGADEITLCLDAKTGDELWRDRYPAQAVTRAAARHSGLRSSPAVAEGKVVTPSASGVLSCLDAASGKLVWRKDAFPGEVPRFFTATSPIIAGGTAIAHLGGSEHGAIMAFDLTSGEPRWTWTGEGPAYDSPVLMEAGGTRQLVSLTEKRLIGPALDTGNLLWSVPAEPRGKGLQLRHTDRGRPDGDLHRAGRWHAGDRDPQGERLVRRQGAVEQHRARDGLQHSCIERGPALRAVRPGLPVLLNAGCAHNPRGQKSEVRSQRSPSATPAGSSRR